MKLNAALCVGVVIGLALPGCSFDTELPPPPGPGSVTGRVLIAEPGRFEKTPVAGAEVRVLGSGLFASTSPAGTFTLDNVVQPQGLLLVRVESGGQARQRLLQLADFGTGPRRKVNLGDIVIGENARVRGRVLRGDVASAGGHAGTTIFVPAGPYTAFTNDDGTFSFEQVPEGPLEIAIFRSGYAPVALGVLELRAGETAEVRDVFLAPAPPAIPGTLRGRLGFLPEVSGRGDSTVQLQSSDGVISAAVADDGAFIASAVPVGLYQLVATRSGYTRLEIANVLVVSGQDLDVGVLTVTTAPAFDAGPPPAPRDAGPADAGAMDAGLDAGVADAGSDDAGFDAGTGTLCAAQVDCASGSWCDRGRCVPLCLTNADCGFGRVCDTAVTRTCQTSCIGQCPAGQLCSASNVCQAICDPAFPCPSGQRCSSGACVPECAIDADCGSAFLSCDLGTCRRNGTCSGDLECSREQLCVSGQCAGRPTDAGVRSDGGTWTDGGALFACSAACQCRVGERCLEGFCSPDIVPTRYVALDGGGSGLTPDAPMGDLRAALSDGGQVVALLADQVFSLGTGTLALPSSTELAGGFTACGPGRWVRASSDRTVLAGVGSASAESLAPVAVYSPAASSGFFDVRLSGVTLRPSGVARCGRGAGFNARFVTGLTLEDLDVELQLGTCGVGNISYGLRIESSTGVTVRRARLSSVSGGGATGTGFIDLSASQGVLEDLTVEPFAVVGTEMRMIYVHGSVGATTLRRLSLGRFTNAPSSTGNFQLVLDTCAATPVTIEDSVIDWPVATANNFGQGTLLTATGCQALTVRRITMTSAGHPGGLFNHNYGVLLTDSGGTVSDLDIALPTATQPVTRTAGLALVGPRATFSISNVTIRGSGGTGTDINEQAGVGMVGVRLDSLVTGPTMLSRIDASLTGNVAPHGLHALGGFGAGAEVSVSDSRFVVEGTNTCRADVMGALVREPIRLERNVFSAAKGALAAGVYVGPTATRVELYGNSILAGQSSGTSACGAAGTNTIFGSHGLVIDGTTPNVRAIGNTVQAAGQTGQSGTTLGLACAGSPTLLFSSNIVATGAGSDARLVSFLAGSTAGAGCSSPASFDRNYFFNGVAGAVSSVERLFDAGISLDGGNWFGGTTSCFAAATTVPDGGAGFPHFLSPGSACADRGAIGTSIGGVVLDRDLFGRTRDGGAGPDIGAVEGD